MKSIIILISMVLIFNKLSEQKGNKPEPIIINIAESFKNPQDLPISKYVDNINYVPLETTPELVLGRNARIEVTEDFIYVKDIGIGQRARLLLFDKNSGKFLREVSKAGRGPGEFNNSSRLPYNSGRKEFYAMGPSNEILVYDLSGKYIQEVKTPGWIDPKGLGISKNTSCIPLSILDNDIFVATISNLTGWQKRKIVLFTKEKIIRIFPNYQTYNKTDPLSYYSPPGGFNKIYKWDKKLFYIETFSDTLYQVTQNALLPRYFFDSGKYRAQYSKQFEIMDRRQTSDYYFITEIDENSNYIFIQIYFKNEPYTGVLDKSTNLVTFCKKGTSCAGLRDDFNGLMDIMPFAFTEKNEMVFIIEPAGLLKWLNDNPEKAALAKTKLPWIRKIDEMSNPIIAIAKCKN